MKSSVSTANGQEVPPSVVTKLTVLGATGSIGLNTLEIVRQFPHKFKIEALSCRSSIECLVEQIKEFQPRLVCVDNSEQARELRETFRDRNSGTETEFVWGVEGLIQISSDPEVDLVVAGIVGAAGLQPTYSAVQAGKTVAVANKEPLVMAGELFVQTANKTGAKLLPIDSEHNAIFQALRGEPLDHIARLILTASGGPFRDLPLKEFGKITLAEALSHPNWEMGQKISIDSATMMNKGLEIIEAQWLFDTPVEKIDVMMHRESIIHSMVEFIDGSFLAQMGLPDMKVPIAYCLGWPERRYPCLTLAIKVAKQGGAAPAVLNGANETVVTAFLGEEIRFVEIAETVAAVIKDFEKALHQVDVPSFLQKISTLEDAEHADKWGRKQASKILESII